MFTQQIILVISIKSTLFIKRNELYWDLNMQEGPIYQFFTLWSFIVTSVANIAMSCFESELKICMR